MQKLLLWQDGWKSCKSKCNVMETEHPHVNPTTPVFAITYDRPSIPLPMMAFIRLKTEEAKDAPWTRFCGGPCTQESWSTVILRKKQLKKKLITEVWLTVLRATVTPWWRLPWNNTVVGVLNKEMYGEGLELLPLGQLPELRIRGAAQNAWPH